MQRRRGRLWIGVASVASATRGPRDRSDGKTTVHWVIAFESQEVRDMVLSTGMADGAGESYDELETLLRTL